MMNKFEKKAELLRVLGETVSRIEDSRRCETQSYRCVDEESQKWEWVDVPYEELEERDKIRVDAYDMIIKHLEKLLQSVNRLTDGAKFPILARIPNRNSKMKIGL